MIVTTSLIYYSSQTVSQEETATLTPKYRLWIRTTRDPHPFPAVLYCMS